MCDDDSDGGFNSMVARTDAVHMGQRRDHTDRSMPAHSQIPRAVEKDETSDARISNGRTQQGTHDSIGTTRFVYNRAAKVVVIFSEALKTIGE
jgi:hypothetical protein